MIDRHFFLLITYSENKSHLMTNYIQPGMKYTTSWGVLNLFILFVLYFSYNVEADYLNAIFFFIFRLSENFSQCYHVLF